MAGVSQPAQPYLPCALPLLTPESPAVARERRFTADFRLQQIWVIGRSHCVTRPVSGSLALRLAGSLHGASAQGLLPTPPASLHAGRSVGMMNTFQFIGLGWRCWRTRFMGFAQISSEFRKRCFERSQFHRQAILINGLQEALAQFAMNFHRRANHRIGLRILFHKICGNRRKSGAPAPPTQTNELKGVHHAN